MVSDGPSPCRYDEATSGIKADLLWWSEGARADNSAPQDTADRDFPHVVSPAEGSACLIVRYPPLSSVDGAAREALRAGGIPANGQRPGMHSTDSLDYVVVLSGEITLILDESEVVLKAGDVAIDRGVLHAWENRGTTEAVLASITTGAIPIGDATGV